MGAPGTDPPRTRGVNAGPEPAGRQLLRIGFGVLWIFDGLLQAQPAMAEGLPSQVIQPAAATSPGWVQHIVNWAGTSWSYHPIQAGASAVWIQIGIGVLLITAPRGWWSRLAALASVGWALVVWVFGEAFGGIFAPGLTWLFGAPGAALFYLAAGLLIAAPERSWRTPQLGRTALSVLGAFFVGMAVLQAWPGRGFWQGTVRGGSGTLTGMIRSMAATPQPAVLAGWVSSFASFTAAHGFAVNLFAVIALTAIGAGLLTAGGGRPALLRLTVIALVVLCLADWVLVEDLGFFGGLGTDPNSMIPQALLGVGRLPRADRGSRDRRPAGSGARSHRRGREPGAGPGRGRAVRATAPGAAGAGYRGIGAASARAVLTVWALVIVFLGAVPMAMAQTNRSADPIIAQAVDGDAAPLDVHRTRLPADGPVRPASSLAGLRGKVVLLTFLDPVCTSDCPLIAQEFRASDQMLGRAAADVELVAIVANPIYLVRRLHASLRPAGAPHRAAKLALPDRHPGPAAAGLAELLRRGRHPATRRDDRPQRRGLRHRRKRAHPVRAEFRSRSWDLQHRVVVRGRAGQRGRTGVEAVVKATWRLAAPTARTAGGAVVIAACVLAAGCGSSPVTTPPTAVPAVAPPLTTASIDATGAGWAIVEMGGSAAQEDNFWELFVRPTGTSPWRLATPAGVADNGGLEAAGTGGSLVAGFRPSQDLTFSPLAATSNDGASWSASGPVTPGLAATPDGLASGSGGQLIALTAGETAELGTNAGENVDQPGQRPGDVGHPGRTRLRADRPHRGCLRPFRGPDAGRQLQQTGNRGHLRRPRRELAGGGADRPPGTGRGGYRRAPAHRDR